MDSSTICAYKQELSGKRVLITGGLGMLGSTVAHKLVECDAKVTIVDACIKPYGANMFNIEGIKDKVDISITDIRDKEAIKFLVKDKDIIFNFAAQVSHNDSIKDPFLDSDINYIGHLNVIENVKQFNPAAKIIFPGSRLQFGRIERIPVDEKHPLNPETPYAFNKTVAEEIYKFYYKMYGIRCVLFRIANPYGPRGQMKHSKYSIINYFLRQAIEDKEIAIYGDGEQIRDYIYVGDLANVFLLAAVKKEADGEIFNIGSAVATKFKDMVNTVVDVVGAGKIKHIPWPDNYIDVETGDYVTDITKISKTLGWKPAVSLRQGIKEMHEYYKLYKRYYF